MRNRMDTYPGTATKVTAPFSMYRCEKGHEFYGLHHSYDREIFCPVNHCFAPAKEIKENKDGQEN